MAEREGFEPTEPSTIKNLYRYLILAKLRENGATELRSIGVDSFHSMRASLKGEDRIRKEGMRYL